MGAINSPYPINKASFTSGVPFYYMELLADGMHVVSRPGAVAQGMVWARGTILKLTPSATAGQPGALTVPAVETDCNCILADNVDTSPTGTNAAGTANVYVSGKFKVDAIVWPGALSHGLIDQNLRLYGLYLESVQQNTGQNILPNIEIAKDPTVKEAEEKALEAHRKALEADMKAAEADQAVRDAQAKADEKAKEDAEKKAKEDAKKKGDQLPPAHEAHAGVTHHDHPKDEPPTKGNKNPSEHHR